MNPVNILPLEVMDLIWSKLTFQDVLSCTLVCRSWYKAISECNKIWRPLCNTTTLKCVNNSWKATFIEEAKIKWFWNEGINAVRKHKVQITVPFGCKLCCCNEDFIYILNFSYKLYKYNESGALMSSIDLVERIMQKEEKNDNSKMCILDENVVLLYNCKKWNEIAIFNEKLKEVKRFKTKDNNINISGGRLWTWEINNVDLVTIYWPTNSIWPNNIQRFNIPNGTVMKPLQIGWCTLTNGEVDWLVEDSKRKLYKVNQTPMAYPTLEILTNNKDIIAIFENQDIENKYEFCKVHIYQNGDRLHEEYINSKVTQMCFSGELLVFGGGYHIYMLNLNTRILLQKDFLESIHPINGLYDIMQHPKLSWIIIKFPYLFIIFDAKEDRFSLDVPISDNFTFSKNIRINYCKKYIKIVNSNMAIK